MNLIITKDYDDMSRKAANILSAQVILNPSSVLGLATGSSPIGTYHKLVEWFQKGDIDFSSVQTVNLDEYKGLPKECDQSYYYFMNQHLFKHINIDFRRTHFPNGMESNSEKECARYNQVIKDMGGIDMQLLGLGYNGHIGFNEPSTTFIKDTHCVTLAERTIDANARFFATIEEVPKQAYTMGIGHIMSARKILLVVSGLDKAKILNDVLNGPITSAIPASILQFHPDVTVVADEAALTYLPKRGESYDN